MANIPILYISKNSAKSTEDIRNLRGSLFDVTFTTSISIGQRLLSNLTLSAVLYDLNLPETQDLKLLQQILAKASDIPVFVLTTSDSLSPAVAAIKLGAYDIVLQPLDISKIEQGIQKNIDAKRPRNKTDIQPENPPRKAADDVQIETKISAGEERFREITENIREIIWLYDLQRDKLEYINPAFEEITGYKREILENEFEKILEIIHPEDRGRIARAREQQVPGEYDETYRFIRPDGEVRWIREKTFPIKNNAGEVYRICGVSEDFTERKTAEEALRTAYADLEMLNRELLETQAKLVQSEKMATMGKLVAGIAHEINTPIGAICSTQQTLVLATKKLNQILETQFPQGLQDQQKLTTVLKVFDDAIKIISSGGERVSTIVKRLRSFARLDEAELQIVDIHEGIEDTLILFQHEMKHQIDVIRNFGDVPMVACYPSKLNQVFLNLLVNAKQAIEGKGTINITTTHRNGVVSIVFADTGKGIPKDQLDKIFDPGFTTKGVGVGTGLGLSIVYQIVKNDHHGDISVESGVGKGSTFFVNIPDNLETVLEKQIG